MNFAGIRCFFLSTALGATIAHPAIATTVVLQPAADTTLVEKEPDNNLGGSDFVNAGTTGMNAGFTRNRGLFQFDLRSIPQASIIKSADLFLEVRFQSLVSVPASYTLHRMLRPWGEGNKFTNASPGLGVLATINEATWNHRFALTTNTWSFPGASNDYILAISSSASISSLEYPHFETSLNMESDVQTWLDNPSANFGWLLKTENEGTTYTARGFGSREFTGEDTNSPPKLEVKFVAPPTIFNPQITNGQFVFSFLAEANEAYKVEFKNALASTNSWLAVTNISAPIIETNIFVSDPISSSTRFYRVIPQ